MQMAEAYIIAQHGGLNVVPNVNHFISAYNTFVFVCLDKLIRKTRGIYNTYIIVQQFH